MDKSDLIKNNLQKVYNLISGEFSASRVFPWEELQIFIPYIKDQDKILDLGCGNGRILNLLKDTDTKYHYMGVDFSEELIKQARIKHPKAHFKVHDMARIDFPPESMDMVLMIASFHHLPNRVERLKLLYRVNKWLKPGGYLFMTNWNLWQKKYMKYFFKNFLKKNSWSDFYIPWKLNNGEVVYRFYHSFTTNELVESLGKTGFVLSPKGIYKTKWNINCLVQKPKRKARF
ncbi:class I SAM-dependent methyltransferase [Candidatus Parcubacteria bacterium]|jgi:ubiquinone/menaquinone biosynthesis C-methylase UbiE|nr:class I SAM-dependent methyltransferase [Candidatus Parcubacteria bacterium]MBT7228762.1 class I SAM-dependent methyltransferase [Candidatus Parcubacteria bacterium]